MTTATTPNVLMVSVYSDGLGTFQARCLSCPDRGPWRRKEAKAVEDAKAHRHEETAMEITPEEDREMAHAQVCGRDFIHTAAECPDYGWDDEGMFIKDAPPPKAVKPLWQVTI